MIPDQIKELAEVLMSGAVVLRQNLPEDDIVSATMAVITMRGESPRVTLVAMDAAVRDKTDKLIDKVKRQFAEDPPDFVIFWSESWMRSLSVAEGQMGIDEIRGRVSQHPDRK